MCTVSTQWTGTLAKGFVKPPRVGVRDACVPRAPGCAWEAVCLQLPLRSTFWWPLCLVKVLYYCQASVWQIAHCEWMLTECHRGFIFAERRRWLEDRTAKRLSFQALHPEWMVGFLCSVVLIAWSPDGFSNH